MTTENPAYAPVDLLTTDLEIDSSIYKGFAAAIMVKGQPRMIALCREYADAVQLMAIIDVSRTPAADADLYDAPRIADQSERAAANLTVLLRKGGLIGEVLDMLLAKVRASSAADADGVRAEINARDDNAAYASERIAALKSTAAKGARP